MSLGNQQAYPTNYAILNAADRVADAREYGYSEMGMTIRQRYAMAALQGMLSDDKTTSSFVSNCNGNWNESRKNIAWTAFQLANAMIAYEEQEHAGGKTKTNEKSEAGEELGDKTT